MVIKFFLYALMCFSTSSLFALGPVISVEVQGGSGVANTPISLTLTIQHEASQQIQEDTFKVDGKPVKPLKTKELKLGGEEELSFYSMQLPAQPQGLYLLPDISVKVGKELYTALRMNYQVVAASNTAAPIFTPNQPTDPYKLAVDAKTPIFKIEALLDFASPLYPTQQGNIGYNYYFNYDMDLKKEELPLLEATGFKKIGGKIVNTSVGVDGVTVFQVIQKIQAESAGEYFFEKGEIEGVPYIINEQNEKIYLDKTLKAETDIQKIVVAPFPTGAPPYFQGAVGQFTINVTLLTQNSVKVGDPLYLAVDIQGLGETEDLLPLALLDYPGFKGFFEYIKEPEEKNLAEEGLRFLYVLNAKSNAVKAIPSIPFSFFDPLAGRYMTVYSEAIPITVTGVTSGNTSEILAPKGVPEDLKEPELIEIQAKNAFTSFDVRSLPLGGTNTLLILPIGGLIVLFFFAFKRYQEALLLAKKKESSKLYEEAFQLKEEDPLFIPLIKKAFVSLWYEKGDIGSKGLLFEEIPVDETPMGKEKEKVREALAAVPIDRKNIQKLFEANGG